MLKDAKHILLRLLQRRFEPQWNVFDSTQMIWRLLKSSKCMILHFVLLKMLNTFASVLANGISAMLRINSSSSGNRKKFQEDHFEQVSSSLPYWYYYFFHGSLRKTFLTFWTLIFLQFRSSYLQLSSSHKTTVRLSLWHTPVGCSTYCLRKRSDN